MRRIRWRRLGARFTQFATARGSDGDSKRIAGAGSSNRQPTLGVGVEHAAVRRYHRGDTSRAMGQRALQSNRSTSRRIRATRLTEVEKHALRAKATYEGNPLHKRNPGDFGLTPPAAPRPDKTLCEEAGVVQIAAARDLLDRAIDQGLVSEATTQEGFPKQLWVVDNDRVFEAMYGGNVAGCYHGYPIRRADPLFDEVVRAWAKNE